MFFALATNLVINSEELFPIQSRLICWAWHGKWSWCPLLPWCPWYPRSADELHGLLGRARLLSKHFTSSSSSPSLRPSSLPAQALLLTGSPCLFSSVTSASPSTGNKKGKKGQFKQKENMTKQKYKRTNGKSYLLLHQQVTKKGTKDNSNKRKIWQNKTTKGQMDSHICFTIDRWQKDKATKRRRGKRVKGQRHERTKRQIGQLWKRTKGRMGIRICKGSRIWYLPIFSAASTSSYTLASQESSRGVFSLCW